MFRDSKIFILGMARSGYEVAKYLSRYNNEILIVDAKEQENDKVKELENLGVKVIIDSDASKYLDETYKVMIKNPGIKYTHDAVVKANNLNIPVVNEVEVASYFFPEDLSVVGITGSNGKTTTTNLIYEILKASGKDIQDFKDYIYKSTNITKLSLSDKGGLLLTFDGDFIYNDNYIDNHKWYEKSVKDDIKAIKELDDDGVIKVVQSSIKKRKDSAEIYAKNGRQELADKELAEIKVLEKYLPAQLDDEAIKKIINEVVASLDDSMKKNFGAVMKAVMAKVGASAEGKKVSELIKGIL